MPRPAKKLRQKRSTPPLLPAAVLRSLSTELQADPRTILRVMRGEPVRGMAGVRVQAGLAKVLEAVNAAASTQEPKP